MRDYGIVSPRFWIGKTGRELRKHPYAQRVALYLMTAPSSEMTGVFYCPVSTILNDVGSPFDGASKGHERDIEGVKSALKALQSLGFCFYDFETEHVFVKEMAKWQIAAKLMPTDKRVKGILRYVETMPEPLRARFVRRYNDDFSLQLSVPPEPEDGSSFEAPSMPLRSQEQDQEQEQEQEKEVVGVAHAKAQTKREPIVVFPETLPDEWRQDALKVRKDIAPERVFLKLRGRYAPTSSKKTLGSWRRIFLDWVGREYADNIRTKAATPAHKDPAFKFTDDYYADSVNPDGTTNWGF